MRTALIVDVGAAVDPGVVGDFALEQALLIAINAELVRCRGKRIGGGIEAMPPFRR